jgi:steroid delta-isomerase-like uncharacterized protein
VVNHVSAQGLAMEDLSRNKQVIRALYEDVLSGRRPLPDEWFAPAFPGGAASFLARVGELRQAFPDIQYTVLDLVAEGDRVAVRWQWVGTQREAFRGFAKAQAPVSNVGMAIFAFADGRIAGVEIQTDRLGFLQQLGVVPTDAALAAPPPVADTSRAPLECT